MRHILVFAVSIVVLAASGCSTQQSNSNLSQSQTQTSIADQSNAQLVIAPKVEDVPAHPLPFKGKLISGNKDELPPAVAMSLSDNSPVTFTYREELTHDDYHVPLAISALDPANLIGAPLGDIGVTAFASLSISSGDTILADYTAKEHASKSYNLYHDVTHAEVDEAARAAVRQRIDQKIYSDEARLAKAVAGTQKTPTASAGQ
jgi:hypothetical protein